jgi:RES domain-containing protein
VYTSASLSLAALELLAHLTRDVELPSDLVAIAAEIPDSIRVTRVAANTLPVGWRRSPAPDALADIGMRWLRDATTAVLAVPSAVIPQETNYLLDPRHPGFAAIRVRRAERFVFDPRLV